MNLKTTIVLVICVVMGGVLYKFGPGLGPRFGWTPAKPNAAAPQTLFLLSEEIKPQNLTRISIQSGDRTVTLEKTAAGEWTLPGRWPTRKGEVEQLVSLVGGLQSRFEPESLENDGEKKLKAYGLDKPLVTVNLNANGKDYILEFNEKASSQAERFSRPTYLRLKKKTGDKVEDLPEVVRLAPGILTVLTRSTDYYQQRRLFPSERVASEKDPQEKVERVAARSITVTNKKKDGHSYRLDRVNDEWQLTDPHRDRADPDKRAALLTALPDVWAEKFIDKSDKNLATYGLEDPPQQSISVVGPTGQTVTLILGKESRREAGKPAPEPNPFAPPRPPMLSGDSIYHYAKLQDNPLIFEIKVNPLQKDVLVAAADLRDSRVARFRAQDVRAIELTQGAQKITFTKEEDNWRLTDPIKVAADNGKVSDLLAKLSTLDAKEKDAVRYQVDPKLDGLDKPTATIKLTIEEEVSGATQPPAKDPKPKKTRTLTLQLGKGEAAEQGQLFVKTDGGERISKVPEDGLLALVKQPALAFRNRRVLDFNSADLAKIEVQRGDQTFAFSKSKEGWKLMVAGEPQVDQTTITPLINDLARLEVVEFATEPKPEETGLDKPALIATLTFTKESDKPVQKLLVGKVRAGKQDYFAKLDGRDEIFLLRKQLHDDLDRGSLAYLPLELWQVPPPKIKAVTIEKEKEEKYTLSTKGGGWQISGPFDASAMLAQTQKIVESLANLRADRYEAATIKDPIAYGFDKPYLQIALSEDGGKERKLIVGKLVDEKSGSRFARLADGEAVVVLDNKVLAGVDQGPLELLDRKVLDVDVKHIEKVRSKIGDVTMTLERKGDGWQVTESPAGIAFPADREPAEATLNVWTPVVAQKFAAYGPKVNPAVYGLDKPAATVTVTLRKEDKPVEHTLTVGKEVENGGGSRYARLDNNAAVMIMSPSESKDLLQGYLDFVDRTLLKFDASAVTTVQRKSGNDLLEIAKKDDAWQVVKPVEQRSDDKLLAELLTRLADLRALRIASYPAKELKEFGLDDPAATLTLRDADGKGDFVLKIGKVTDETSGDRFVTSNRLTNGQPVVGVLPGALARRLTAPPIAFRDRSLARFADADRAILERGPRKAVFAKVDGTWRLVDPVEAEAEQADLEDLINALARLRADELVAEKPGDLKPYGLDKPELRWRFQSGDKDVLSLLIGSKEKDGPRHYAKLANGDIVFLLDPKLTGRLLAEYRTRNAWPTPLDAVQIDRLTYRGPRGNFTLVKMDNTWEVAGKSDLKLNPQTVNETLAALAGLRALRFVQDKDSDLNLYGLEPVETVIEIESRTGKRVLHLGRVEGESKRHYARVPEKGRPGVFVIAESDVERLLRDPVAFTREPAPPIKPVP